MIGVTGHGKSSTANSICGDPNKFKVSEAIRSETNAVKGIVTTWEGKPDTEKIIVVDTPGIGDSEGRDTEHIANMVTSLKKIGFVTTFLIVINSEEPRFNELLKQTIKLFISMFGDDFLKNSLLCFSKFGFDEKSLRLRKSKKSPN